MYAAAAPEKGTRGGFIADVMASRDRITRRGVEVS
jgi:hypothetical protein